MRGYRKLPKRLSVHLTRSPYTHGLENTSLRFLNEFWKKLNQKSTNFVKHFKLPIHVTSVKFHM